MGDIKRPLAIILLVVASLSVSAQLEKFQAAFIYNFTKYMEWPAEQRQGDFVIGVINNQAMVSALNKMVSGKLVGMQKIMIKSFNSINDISDCHMYYLPPRASNKITILVSKLEGKNAIILGSKYGLTRKGADINFVIMNEKQSFEINTTGIKKKGITVSSALEELASKVY